MATLKHTSQRSPYWRASLFYFSLWAVMGAQMPFFNVYFARLGLSGLQIGILSAAFPLMTLLVGPALALLADRRRWQKRMLLISIGGTGALLILFIFPRTFAPLLLLVLVRAALFSPMMSIGDGMVARMAARHRIDYGKLRLWGSLSFAIAALICGALWERWGFQAMFIVTSLLTLPVLWSATGLEESAPAAADQQKKSTAAAPTLHNLRRDQGLIVILLAVSLVGIAEGMYGTFSGVYMDQLGGGQLLVGALFGLSALAEPPVMHYSGAIFRKLGKPVSILLAYGLVGIAFLGYGLVRQPWLILAFAMLKGAGFALYFVGNVSLIDERAPEAWTSTLQSLMNAATRGLAPLVTNPLAGWLADSMGLPVVFIGSGIAALLAAGVVFGAVVRRQFEARPLLNEDVMQR
ncbi:MAG TPA: MFS transporter [Anaerolineae bacterium]|nr:MFS transporter [Anaerolineae bacterium]HQI85251.1 MFS transporter [Anaerolineae bacterium]